MSVKEITLHLHHATNTINMQKLKRLFEQLRESERVELVTKLMSELNVHKTTIYRWANGSTKPAHKLIEEKANQIIEDFSLEITIRRHSEASEARNKLNQN
ncbi:MAG: hypothetical protein JXR36_08130 [Bacteroidales bacterium]|nr:hypothetical protein [Bacteroidales bacterium]